MPRKVLLNKGEYKEEIWNALGSCEVNRCMENIKAYIPAIGVLMAMVIVLFISAKLKASGKASKGARMALGLISGILLLAAMPMAFLLGAMK